MTASIAEIYSYPVKGLSGQILASARLETGATIQSDRRFALGRPGFAFDTENPVWMPKTNFLALVRDERLAELESVFDPDSTVLTLHRDGRPVLRANLSTPDGRDQTESYFAEFLHDEIAGRPTLLEAADHSFSDLDAKVLSLINLESVRALGAQIGRDVDARRFRANIYFDDTPAWSEFAWLDRTIRIGGATARVIKRTQRCAATSVNPETAQRDMNIPRALADGWGHADLGVYARVIEAGDIHPGDKLSLLDR